MVTQYQTLEHDSLTAEVSVCHQNWGSVANGVHASVLQAQRTRNLWTFDLLALATVDKEQI